MVEIHPERYRSGHNGADSKSVCEQSHMGSNPILSAKALKTQCFQGFSLFFEPRKHAWFSYLRILFSRLKTGFFGFSEVPKALEPSVFSRCVGRKMGRKTVFLRFYVHCRRIPSLLPCYVISNALLLTGFIISRYRVIFQYAFYYRNSDKVLSLVAVVHLIQTIQRSKLDL